MKLFNFTIPLYCIKFKENELEEQEMEGRMRKVDKSTHGRRGKNRMKKIEEKNNPETARDRPEKVEKQYRKKLEMRCEGTRVNTNTCIIIFEYKTLHARIQKMFPVGPMQIYFLPGRLGRGGSKTYFFLNFTM